MFKTTQTDPYETEFGGTTIKRIQPRMSVRTVVLLGLLTALTIVCERFLVWQTPISRISLAFLPKAICGAMLGPIYSALICGVSDIVGFISVPQPGPFNPIITLASVLRGLIYGFLLYKKHDMKRIVLAALLDHLVAGMIVTTFALSIFIKNPISQVFLNTRVTSCLVGFAIEIIVFVLISDKLFDTLKKLNSDDRY